MDDLISREAAIDAVERTDWYHQNSKGVMVHGANSDEHQAWYKADDIYKALRNLLSAHPSYSCDGCKTPKHICGICMRNYSDHYCTGEAWKEAEEGALN